MAWRQHAAIQSRGQHFPVDKTIGTPPAGKLVTRVSTALSAPCFGMWIWQPSTFLGM